MLNEKFDTLLKSSIDGKILDKTITLITKPGENFGGLMYKIDLKVANDDKEIKNLNIVAKCPPVSKIQRDLLALDHTFKNEIAYYKYVVPALQEFLSENGQELMDLFPKFYGARISLNPKSTLADENAVLLLENLSAEGYTQIDKSKGFDLVTTKLVLKKLVALHAVPMAIKLRNPKIFEEKIRNTIKHIKIEDQDTADSVAPFFQTYLNFIKNDQKLSSYSDKIEQLLKVNPWFPRPVREPWATAQHGDFWINNIMLKKDTNGTNLKILDLQATSYSSVATDLFIFLMTSVEPSVIEQNFDYFLKFYWQKFTSTLNNLKADTSNFSYEGLLEEIKQEIHNGKLARCLTYIFVIYSDKEDAGNVSDADYSLIDDLSRMSLRLTENHKAKYRFITSECAKKGWFSS